MKHLKTIFCALLLLVFSGINFRVFADDPDCYARVVLVGNYHCGKTSIWRRIFGDPFNEAESASDLMNCRFVQRELSNGKKVQFNIWDTAGAKEFYDEVISFLDGANFVIIVHDLSSEYTKENGEYLNKLCHDVKAKLKSDAKLILIGSKWDKRNLAGADYVNFANQKALLEQVSQVLGCHMYVTSATEGLAVGQSVPQFVIKLLSYIKDKSESMELYDRNPDGACAVDFKVKKGFRYKLCTLL